MAKPSVVPSWATTDITDPTSGVNNKVEPSAADKANGFVPLNVKPSRQSINWLHWITGEWITWLDASVNQELNTDSNVQFLTASVNELTAITGINTNSLSSVFGNILLHSSIDMDGNDIIDAGDVSVSGTLSVGDKASLNNAVNSIAGSDTNITGNELETLSNGGNADASHVHSIVSYSPDIKVQAEYDKVSTVFAGKYVNLSNDGLKIGAKAILTEGTNSIAGSDTNITGNELEALSNGSNADSLHKHDNYVMRYSSPWDFVSESSSSVSISSKGTTINNSYTVREQLYYPYDFLQYVPFESSFIKKPGATKITFNFTLDAFHGTAADAGLSMYVLSDAPRTTWGNAYLSGADMSSVTKPHEYSYDIDISSFADNKPVHTSFRVSVDAGTSTTGFQFSEVSIVMS